MRWRAPTLRKNPSMEPPYVYFLFLPFFMQLQLLKILSPIIMASYLVRETDFQLIVIVHGNMGEAGGTTTLMKFCTANWNLNSICPHSGSNCTIQWAKLTPEADKNDPKTFEMKIRPADFSYSPWGSRNFFFGRIFLLNNCLYEIIYQILLQDSVMFSGGLKKLSTIYQATWLI